MSRPRGDDWSGLSVSPGQGLSQSGQYRWRQTDQSGPRRDIRLQQSPDSQWTARNLDHGLTAQGKTSREAPDALEDVVEAVHDEGGHEPTDPEVVDGEQAELAQDAPRHQEVKTTHTAYREERVQDIKTRGDDTAGSDAGPDRVSVQSRCIVARHSLPPTPYERPDS